MGQIQRHAHFLKKVSDEPNLKKKSVTNSSDLEKSKRHVQPGKSLAMVATWEKVSVGLVRAAKKSQRHAQHGKNRQQARPAKRVSDGLNLRKKAATDSFDLKKKISDLRNLKRKSATESCDLETTSATCVTLGKISDGPDLWKNSDVLILKKSQRRARSVEKINDECNLKKKPATDSCDLEKRLRHAQLGEKSATGETWKKVSHMWILKKKSMTGATCEKSQRRA